MIFFLPKIDLGRPKLLQLQNLGGGFVVFLGGQNRNFMKVMRRKLILSYCIKIGFLLSDNFSFVQLFHLIEYFDHQFFNMIDTLFCYFVRRIFFVTLFLK